MLSLTCAKYEYAKYYIQLIETLLRATNNFELTSLVNFAQQLIEFLRVFHNRSIERLHALLTSVGITKKKITLVFAVSASKWRM